MAANPKSPVSSGSVEEQYHIYHAEAHILTGALEHPVKQVLENYGRVVLEHTRRESLITQSVGETNIEGLISFRRGHTRVAGTQVQFKTDIFGNNHAGWVTLSTAAIEGYNVVDTITADRVVAQVSTEHAMVHGDVPSVTFLGSRFENLRIGGFPVEVELDLDFCGAKPKGDVPYVQDEGFLDRVARQVEGVAKTRDVPDKLKEKCGAEIANIDGLRMRARELAKERGRSDANGGKNGYSKLRCSLVKNIGPIPIPGVKTIGNIIFIPNFGTVALAELEVGINSNHGDFPHRKDDGARRSDSNYFTLNMFEMQLGCPVGGGTKGPGVNSNGSNGPGH